jgi:FHA domain/Double zinc ribbon
MAIVCTQCKHSNPDDTEFCEMCGAQLAMTPAVAPVAATPAPMPTAGASDKMVCPNCNTPFAAGDAFCFNCGYDLRNEGANKGAAQPATAVATPATQNSAPTPAVTSPTGSTPTATQPPDLSEDDWDKAFDSGGDLATPPAPPVNDPAAVATPTPAVATPTSNDNGFAAVAPPPPVATPPQRGTGPISTAVPNSLKLNVTGPHGNELIEWKGVEILLGRQDAKTRVFPHVNLDDGAASRRHLAIWKDETDGYFYAQDLESSNGSLLNSKEMDPGEPMQLKNGDIIKIGTRYSIEAKIS